MPVQFRPRSHQELGGSASSTRLQLPGEILVLLLDAIDRENRSEAALGSSPVVWRWALMKNRGCWVLDQAWSLKCQSIA